MYFQFVYTRESRINDNLYIPSLQKMVGKKYPPKTVSTWLMNDLLLSIIDKWGSFLIMVKIGLSK